MPSPVPNHRRFFFRSQLWGLLLLAVIPATVGVLAIHHLLASPRVVLLTSQDGADWLRVDLPFDSGAKFNPNTAAVFQTTVSVPPGFSGAALQVTALRRFVATIDSIPLFDSGPDLDRWRTPCHIPLSPHLSPGPHQLQFVVSNLGGPSMLRVYCPELNLRSDDRWLASPDGLHWKPAIPADRPWDPLLPPQFGSTLKDLTRLSPLLICLFAIGAAALSRRPGNTDWGRRVRWMLLLAWCVLAINNITKVPLEYGYDADQHMRYIQYVADHLSLPRPDAGWQFFQAPLYYVLSAMLDRLLLLLGVAAGTVPYLLRVIPLACGGAMIEICYRCARLVFPDRSDLQAIATTIGGLLPMNIYMAQAVSNEPLAAVLSGLIVLSALRFLSSPQSIHSPRALLLLGLTFGTALLTKVSTVIWCLPIGLLMFILLYRETFKQQCRAIAIIAASALAVCGWFLVRNLFLIHRPFFLESSLATGQWWQDPGYRTPRMFLEFGHVFDHPIYNGLASVWDSLYGSMWGNGILIAQPRWNFGLMSAGLWLALIPMLAIFLGISQAIAKRTPTLLFAVLAITCFIPAILYVYLTLPIYSCAKASYMLGTTPCIALLAAAGFNTLISNRLGRALTGGAILCWAVTSYLTYFTYFAV